VALPPPCITSSVLAVMVMRSALAVMSSLASRLMLSFSADVDVAGRCDQRHPALHEQAHAAAGAGQQAFADRQAGVAGAAQGQVFAGGDVVGARRGQGDAGGAGEHQVRLGEFGELIGGHVRRTAAEHALVLLVQRFGDVVLITGLLGLLCLFGQAVLLVAGGGQAFSGFGQVLVVLGFVGRGSVVSSRPPPARMAPWRSVRNKTFTARLPPLGRGWVR
jgi:hypothetical protein